MKKSPFLSVSRFAKILRKSQSKKSNKKMLKKEDSGKKKTTLKKKKSKKKIIDGNNITLADKIKKMKTPIQFFKTILNHHDKKNIIPSGDITETTKEFFKGGKRIMESASFRKEYGTSLAMRIKIQSIPTFFFQNFLMSGKKS